MNNSKGRKYSLDDVSFVEEMKAKLRILNSMHQTTNAMMVRFDIHQKRTNQQKSGYSMAKKRALRPISYRSIEQNLPRGRRKLEAQPWTNIDSKLVSIESISSENVFEQVSSV